jgi:hypothetical protein
MNLVSLDGSTTAFLPAGKNLLNGVVITPAEADVIRKKRREISENIDRAINLVEPTILNLMDEADITYTPCSVGKFTCLAEDTFEMLDDPSSDLFDVTLFEVTKVTTTFSKDEGKISVAWKYDSLWAEFTENTINDPSEMDACLVGLIKKIVGSIAYKLNVPDAKNNIMVGTPAAAEKTNKRQKK